MSFMDEIRKIPPVTRFLCGSSLAVSVPVMLQVVSPYKVLFVRELVTYKLELWRIPTSFFLGSSGINYIFEFMMLYRYADQLESLQFAGRSADYAWQLLLASAGILALNLPLRSFVHTRPLLLMLTYLNSRLAPAGTQTSLFGLLTFPLVYLPYALLAMDLVMSGPGAVAQGITGLVMGHLWWWAVWGQNGRQPSAWVKAPGWLRALVGDGPGVIGGTGVQVIPPRRGRETASSTGHRWGSGNRLGGT